MTALLNPYWFAAAGPPPGGGDPLAIRGTSTSSDSGTTHTVTLPSSSAGDYILIFAGRDGTNVTFTPPTGFELLTDPSASGMAVFGKEATGSEGSSVTFDTSSARDTEHAVIVFESGGVATGWPVFFGRFSSGDDAPETPQPWGDNETDFLWVVVGRNRSTGTFTGAPTDYGNLLATDNGSDIAIGVARRELTADVEDPGAWTITGATNSNYAAVAVVRPGATAGLKVADRFAGFEESSVTGHTVRIPGETTDGDLIVVAFANDHDDAVTLPGGWTQIFSVTNSSSVRLTVAAKEAGPSDAGSKVTFTTAGGESSIHRVWVVTGWDDSGTIGDAVEYQTATGSSAPDPPSLSPSWGSDECVWLAVFGVDGSSRRATAAPSGYGSLFGFQTADSGVGHISFGAADKVATASSDNPGTFTVANNGNHVVATVAVRLA